MKEKIKKLSKDDLDKLFKKGWLDGKSIAQMIFEKWKRR